MEDGRGALRYSVRREPEVAVIEVMGELDLATVDELREVALDIFATGQPNLALDLSGVTFLDSTGIGVIVDIANHGRERNGAFTLLNPSPPALRVIELTGIDRHLEVTLDSRER